MALDISIVDQMRIAVNYVRFKTKQKHLRTTEKIIADTTYGKVKGVKWLTIYGSTYYSFEGIPFAKPPVGKLRFKAPVEPEPWIDVKRCTRQRDKPCQYNLILKLTQGKEDCLYLNVYTKELNPDKPLPVLVWIYGGGFQIGEASRDIYSPDYFMMENAVLITISYRLGPLGFLSLSDETLDVPGNAGLKDQVMALRWVKRNCQFFGGNPENITIIGESAGGSSVHFMMQTEQTRDLFHRAVIMSGSAIAPWSTVPQLNWNYRLATACGYKGEQEDQAIFAYLNKCKASVLFKMTDNLVTIEERHRRIVMFSFGPTIEPYITKNCVIPKPPIEMMRDGWGNSIPLLIGGNSFEGLLMFLEVRKYPVLLNNLGDGEFLAPTDAGLSEEEHKAYGKLLKDVYFGDSPANLESILQYSDLFSYKYFWHPIQRTLYSRTQHATAPTWLYRFDFDSKHFNFMRIVTCGRKVRGTCHADDLFYLFYNAVSKKLKQRTIEYKTIRRLVSIMVQFAECGNPNIPLTDALSDCWSNGANDTVVGTGGITTDTTSTGDENNGLLNESIASADNEILVTNQTHSEERQQQKQKAEQEQKHQQQQQQQEIQQNYWLPVTSEDKIFKCLNISDELEVIDLPETEKLKLWNQMYKTKNLLY